MANLTTLNQTLQTLDAELSTATDVETFEISDAIDMLCWKLRRLETRRRRDMAISSQRCWLALSDAIARDHTGTAAEDDAIQYAFEQAMNAERRMLITTGIRG